MVTDFAVLHTLRIKGFATVEAIGRFIGRPDATAEIDAVVARLADAELVQFRAGRLQAWALTPAGRTAHAELLSAERDAADDALRDVHSRFLELNDPFKQLCTDWQLEGRSAERERRLDDLHAAATALVGDASAAQPRLAPYGPRLADAHQRVAAGDDTALTRPLAESYHDVWMELHQDLLVTLDVERSAADGS